MAKKKTSTAIKKKPTKKSAKSKPKPRNTLANKTLVIVESPAKAKTINKYLGKDYIIEASLGHIIDLPKSRMAVDVDKHFEPEYITVRGRAKILNRLKSLAASVRAVLLAADPDREGEAISWHLKRSLSVKNPNVKRIEFNEITQIALQKAIQNPREIDNDLVNAQQARRILDRLVGYNISPLLWQKIKRGLSAGRVQSVALKEICAREAEIEKFVEQEYWTLGAYLTSSEKSYIIKAELHSIDGERQEGKINSQEKMDAIIEQLKEQSFIVSSITSRDRKRSPTAPYTTSKLQQDASTKLKFSSQKTMMVAQQLYEGLEVGSGGLTGLITYMRTDSNRTAPDAMNVLRDYIKGKYGENYLSEETRYYKNKRGAQDAHEAIRPTDPRRSPQEIISFLSRDQFRLYQMIWQKFVSSQMANEVSTYLTVDIRAGVAVFRAGQRTLKFDGFSLVFEIFDKKEDKNQKPIPLDELKEGLKLTLKDFEPKQHFTQPPPRYNDATMVKTLEEGGVGRPSTYAPTIQTLLKRYYVTRGSNRFLQPSELGMIVNRIMNTHFPLLVDMKFTAKMEEELDMIAGADLNWVKMLRDFYDPFIKTLKDASEKIEDMKTALDVPTEHVCEKCGTNMVKRLGRNGYFLACPRFPECRNAQPLPLTDCAICDTGKVVRRATKKGRPFYSCNRYPDCEFSTWNTPTDETCPECGRLLFLKTGSNRSKQATCLKCDTKPEDSLNQSA